MTDLQNLEQQLGKDTLPPVHVGDTVEVHYLISEGDKERIQLFIGTVIRIKGRGVNRAITVRRIVQGEGVERIFPLHNPRVKDVVISRRGEVRRAKLYYLRERVGKMTRVRELLGARARRQKQIDAANQSEIAAAPPPAAAEQAGDDAEAHEEAVEV